MKYKVLYQSNIEILIDFINWQIEIGLIKSLISITYVNEVYIAVVE